MSKSRKPNNNIDNVDNVLPDIIPDLQFIILEYVAENPNHLASQNFLSGLIMQHSKLANIAASYYLIGDIAKVDEMVQADPLILTAELSKLVDPIGRKIEGITLYQLAVLSGDNNPRKVLDNGNNYGQVEKFNAYLTPEEISNQKQELGNLLWSDEKLIKIRNIILTFIPLIISSRRYNERKRNIAKYENAMLDCFGKTTGKNTGFILDPRVFIMAAELFNKNFSLTFLENDGIAFIIHTIGFFQRCLPICDLILFNTGLEKIYKPDSQFPLPIREPPDWNKVRMLGNSCYITQNGNYSSNLDDYLYNSVAVKVFSKIFPTRHNGYYKNILEQKSQLELPKHPGNSIRPS